MKKALFVFGFLFFTFFTQAQIVSIPDANFKIALLNYTPAIDTNSDGEIQVSEALVVTSLDLSNGNFSDVTGINSFTNLQSLDCSFCYNLTVLDFSGMTNLQSLNCNYCYGLTTLNISDLSNLQSLSISWSPLVVLNVSGLANLQTLICTDCNQLTTLDVSGLNNLQSLNCSSCNQLITLNASGLTNLQILKCSSCYQLTTLNTTGSNNIINLNCENNSLSSLVVTNMTNLQVLNCGHFSAGNYGLTTLDLTGLNALTKLYCHNNYLTALDVSNLINLTTLNCNGNLISSLNLSNINNLTSLTCSNNQLTTLDVAGLTNLTSLRCSFNQLTTLNVVPLIYLTSLECNNNNLSALDVSSLINLTSLGCSYNQLTALDVSTLINLTTLGCYYNSISSINLSNITNLINLDCSQNQLSVLNVSNLTALTGLYVGNNQLTTLDVTNLVHLDTLFCNSNQLTSIDLQNLTNLLDFWGSQNLFTTLDFSHTGTAVPDVLGGLVHTSFDFDDNPNLVYVNLKNEVAQLPDPLFQIVTWNCPTLQYICTNENSVLNIINKLQQQDDPTNSTISSNIQVNSYCSFVPGGNYNTITGNLTLDINNNGCDVNDIPLNNVKVFINDGVNTGAAFTNTTGNYTFYTQAGNFVITPNFENPFFTVSPTSATLNFANNNNNSQTQNFCITSVGVHNDLEIVIIPITSARPGFDATYRLVYKNKGNQVQSGNINLYFNDAVLDFVSANPMTASQTLNNLNWDFTNLNPFETRTIDFVLNVNSPMEMPPVNIDDVLSFTATVYPIQEDETNEDNIFTLNQIVVGSFDPNDKTCLEGNAITPEMVGDYLHYVIRFQNSGTAAAQNIVVKDIIDTAKFDINTLQLTSSSHANVARIAGNKVEFIFENINLPAEVNNEPGSHGYVAFKIKSKSNLVLGNVIQNKADIFFDYNFPIVTNTTSTTVAVLHVNDFDNNSVSITPIPVTDVLQIKALENITRVQLFDIQGRLLQTNVENSIDATLDFSEKSKGVYLVKVQTEKGMKVQKVIKE